MSVFYSLAVSNLSARAGSFCIYQEVPDVSVAGVATLAWLAEVAEPTTKVEFHWSLDYDFYWSEQSDLGVASSQCWTANLSTMNEVDFKKVDGAYTFANQRQGVDRGTMTINQLDDVSRNEALVGIGMSGSGTFVFDSMSNRKLVFTPPLEPTYWLAFGDFAAGKILDVAAVRQSALKLTYQGVTDMRVEFTAGNTWAIV